MQKLKWGQGNDGRIIKLVQSHDQFYLCIDDGLALTSLVCSNNPDVTDRLVENSVQHEELLPLKWDGGQ